MSNKKPHKILSPTEFESKLHEAIEANFGPIKLASVKRVYRVYDLGANDWISRALPRDCAESKAIEMSINGPATQIRESN